MSQDSDQEIGLVHGNMYQRSFADSARGSVHAHSLRAHRLKSDVVESCRISDQRHHCTNCRSNPSCLLERLLTVDRQHENMCLPIHLLAY